MGELKTKALNGVVWNSIQRFASMGIRFFFMIFMTRLLLPSDYGMVGLLAIFLEIANVFIDSGFPSALVRKPDRTEVDESSVFYFNIFVSTSFYILLFLFAPLIGKFYDMPELATILRVLGLTLIINSFSTIQTIVCNIKLDFKTPSLIYIICSVISGTFGVILAMNGFGVWALVWQQLFSSFCITLSFWIFARWRPLWVFSMKSLKEMFAFGSNLLGTSVLNVIYRNISPIFIGKYYSPSDLGLYSRADQLVAFPSGTLQGVLISVSYPVLCKVQSNKAALTEVFRQFIQLTAFILFPVMVLLGVLSTPVIDALFGDNWSGASVYMPILCFPLMLVPLQCINLNVLKVVGRSDLILRLEIIGKVSGVIMLAITLPISIIALCYGTVVNVLICFFINTYYTARFVDLTVWGHIKDISRSLLLALVAGVAAFLVAMLFTSAWAKVLVGGSVGVMVYVGMAMVLRMKEYYLTIDLVKQLLHRNKKSG